MAINGYYNGKEFIPLDKVDIKPNQRVIITVLDDFVHVGNEQKKSYRKYAGKLSAASYEEISEALKDTEKVDTDEW